MIEIYMEKIQDLLDRSKTNLKVAEDKLKGIFIQDVTEQNVVEETEVYNFMKIEATKVVSFCNNLYYNSNEKKINLNKQRLSG